MARHYVGGDLSGNNVGKIFGLFKILTMICDIVVSLYSDWYYSLFALVIRSGLFSSFGTVTGCLKL